MKVAVNVLALLVCTAVLYVGQLHWNEKVSGQTDRSEKLAPVEESDTKGAAGIHSYTKNLPSDAAQKIEKAYESQKPLQLVIAGSDSLGTGDTSWPMLFKENLEKVYGDNVFDITIKNYGNMTTKDMVVEEVGGQWKELNPDMVLLQPPMIHDNGVVGIEHTMDNLEVLVKEIKGSGKGVILMIQPPHPLYQATYYPRDIEALQNFAKEKNIFYLDHWKKWPDFQSDELLQYLEEDSSAPNEKGHQLWADFLTSIFTGTDIKSSN
jgi:hypothetical protein